MNINGHEILLQVENPIRYDLAWRHSAVLALEDGGKRKKPPAVLKSDPHIRGLLRHLRGGGTARGPDYGRILAWHADNTVRGILEALLLSEAKYETVAADMGGVDVRDVQAYQALFFSVRDDQGRLASPNLLRLRFASGRGEEGGGGGETGVWKRAALTGGYRLLQTILGNFAAAGTPVEKADPAELVDLVVEQEIARRVLGGELQPRELTAMRTAGIARERLRFDTGDHKSRREEGWEFAQALLEKIAPEPPNLLPPSTDQARASEVRRDAERCIAAQEVSDRGPAAGSEMINQLLREKAQSDKAQRKGGDAKTGDSWDQIMKFSGG